MRRKVLYSFNVLSVLAIAFMLGGCGSALKEGAQSALAPDVQNAARLGDINCLQCHNAGQDLTMVGFGDASNTIGVAWSGSLHHINNNGTVTVHCEDCHGGGGLHFGQGPLANPV